VVYKYRKKQFFKPGDFPVAVVRVREAQTVPVHTHEFSEIVVVLKGSGMHGAGNNMFPIRAGDVYVFSGKQVHEYKDLHDFEYINILYKPDELHLQMRDLKSVPGYHALFTLEPAYRTASRFESYLNLPPDELARVDGWVSELESELKSKAPGHRFMAAALFMRIVGHLSRCYGRSQSAAPAALIRMGEAISFIENHYDEPVSLGELAKIAHMSKRNFMRTFRKALGQPPIQYLIALRVARAAELLRDDSISITEAAFDAGFDDSNYFSRKFRQVMGETPRDYRRKTRQTIV